jgi:hypothetical protein
MALYARIDMFYIQTMNNDDQLKISAVPNQILKWHTAKKQYRKFETDIPRKGIARPKSQFPHSCICERFLFSHDQSAYSAAGNMWTGNTYINHSQTLECGNWDWDRAVSRKGIHKWDFLCSACYDAVNHGLRVTGLRRSHLRPHSYPNLSNVNAASYVRDFALYNCKMW